MDSEVVGSTWYFPTVFPVGNHARARRLHYGSRHNIRARGNRCDEIYIRYIIRRVCGSIRVLLYHTHADLERAVYTHEILLLARQTTCRQNCKASERARGRPFRNHSHAPPSEYLHVRE